MLTLSEINEELKTYDEILLLEWLNISAEDIVERFSDIIEVKEDELRAKLQEPNDED